MPAWQEAGSSSSVVKNMCMTCCQQHVALAAAAIVGPIWNQFACCCFQCCHHSTNTLAFCSVASWPMVNNPNPNNSLRSAPHLLLRLVLLPPLCRHSQSRHHTAALLWLLQHCRGTCGAQVQVQGASPEHVATDRAGQPMFEHCHSTREVQVRTIRQQTMQRSQSLRLACNSHSGRSLFPNIPAQ